MQHFDPTRIFTDCVNFGFDLIHSNMNTCLWFCKWSLEDCRNFPFVFNLLFFLLNQIYIPPSTPSGFTHWANKYRWNCSTYLPPDEGLLETDQTQTRISNYGILLSARLFSKETWLYHWRLTKMCLRPCIYSAGCPNRQLHVQS